MTPLDLRGICMGGGCVVVSAIQFSPLDLRGIASAAKGHGGKLIIKQATRLSVMSCRSIALAGGEGTVTFDFTE